MKAMQKTNIVLIGYMGSGKTVIGRETAKLLDYDFVDTDAQVAEVTGLTLPQLFRKHGEIRFRSEERLVLRKLLGRERLVIAYGGSLLPENRDVELLRDQGYFVLLTADPSIIHSRLARKSDRLMIGGRPSLETVERLLRERKAYFRDLAELVVDSGRISVDEAAEQIVAAFRASQQKGVAEG